MLADGTAAGSGITEGKAVARRGDLTVTSEANDTLQRRPARHHSVTNPVQPPPGPRRSQN